MLTKCSSKLRRYSRRHSLLRRLNRRRRILQQTKEKKEEASVKSQMEMNNLKLYMQNKNIIQENEKLRKQAFLLHQENQDLIYQLQKMFSKPHALANEIR